MAVVRIITQIVYPQIQQTRLPCSLNDALVQRPRKHCRKEREHVDLHCRLPVASYAMELRRCRLLETEARLPRLPQQSRGCSATLFARCPPITGNGWH